MRQFLKGVNKLNGRSSDARLPITLPLLTKILQAIPKVISLQAHQLILSAVFFISI